MTLAVSIDKSVLEEQEYTQDCAVVVVDFSHWLN